MSRMGRAMAAAIGLAALPAAAVAQTESRTAVEVIGSGGYSSNPFASNGGSAGFAELRVRPTLELRTERDTLNLAADAQIQQYFRRYSTRDNYNARMSYVRRESERLTLTGSASYLNAISGSAFSGLVVPEEISPEPPVAATDLGLFGIDNRRQTVSAQVGAALRVSTVDQVNAYVNAIATDNNRPGLAVNYHGYGGGLGYARQVSETIRLGITGTVNQTEYSRSASTTVYGVQGTFDARLNERWTLNGGLGLSRLESSNAPALVGSIDSTTIASGNATLCRRNPTGQFCLGASRAILPSSFGGARVQTTIDASYRARLSERASITARSAYTNVDGDNTTVFPALRYWANTLGYQHRLRERLALSATALYRTVDGGGAFRQRDDVGGTIGLAVTLGQAR